MKEESKIEVRLVSASEMARILGISVRTLRRLRQRGVITPVAITSACIRYDFDEVLGQVRKQGKIS